MKKILTSKKKLSYNEYLKRNEGSTMSKTSKLWRRAKKINSRRKYAFIKKT